MSKIGIIYMTFGNNAVESAEKSIASIKAIGIDLPIATIGTHKIQHTTFIPWYRHQPWTDDKANPDQRFRAGYVKPFVYEFSPFDYTLYLDADTEIQKDFRKAFNYLSSYDLCVVHGTENRTLGRSRKHFQALEFAVPFWNQFRGELEYSCAVLGPETRIMNSGVIFFRKSPEAQSFFKAWYEEWLRFGGWEEQHAFLRVERNHPAKIFNLSTKWNQKHLQPTTIIWHRMGKGSARDPKPKEEQSNG
jgi:hypothetical protein